GNKDIDALIKKTKKESLSCDGFIEWIPIFNIEYIKPLEQGGCSKIYLGIWKPFKSKNKTINKQKLPNLNVVLKVLKNSQDFNDKFLNEIAQHSFEDSNSDYADNYEKDKRYTTQKYNFTYN
ncbi:7472_t:CDS:2, partial [Dentiscutata heterogama]